MIRLNVNIDHIATLRQARRTYEPSVVAAAVLADLAGASGITIHLRGDRRHIQDDDARVLREVVKTHLNMEMAATEEMVRIAREIKPSAVTFVPERADEVTTEGGLDVVSREEELRRAAAEVAEAGVLVSLFVDPDMAQIEASQRVGARQVEICTARYAELTDPTQHGDAAATDAELARIAECADRAGELGLQVAAGHGLTYRNVAAIAETYPIEELNIGHNIVARAALVGMERAVREMIAAMNGRLL
ncbi:MAG TPA: pyridoxine 5'-phosphate synthase [Blastocatellia bacterium]|nr:pyridoxine 5'-phosphate synthase [Blastocatellia bacterium]